MGYYATAQILIGSPITSFIDRFTPAFVIYLAENSRPSLVLNATSIHKGDQPDFEQVIWVPTIENMLEDALLMIVLYLHKDPKIVEAAGNYFELTNKVECYDIPENGREQLYEMLENYQFRDYFIFSVFDSSSLVSQIERLNHYHIDGEICLARRIDIS